MSAPTPFWPDYPVIDDPARPVWHFGPLAQWMNDPNGTLWHDGWYHVFYQHNPGGEEWADIHWGHGRSRDLVHWEHLPLALRPQHADGEKHCYSGCLALTATGEPRILYTSVPADSARPATQVLAIPDDSDWRAWTQQVGTPFLDLATHGGPAFDFDRKWRDPFVYRAEGRTFLILGATLGTEAVIPLYENPDGGLRHWVYRGIIHCAPRTETPFFECANLIRFGSKWLLITSPCREVEWCSGTLDLGAPAFRAGPRGRVDEGDGFYATQFVRDPAGRTVLFGWVRNFPKQRGWNGCLGAPRLARRRRLPLRRARRGTCRAALAGKKLSRANPRRRARVARPARRPPARSRIDPGARPRRDCALRNRRRRDRYRPRRRALQ